jgi:hypothetical protein
VSRPVAARGAHFSLEKGPTAVREPRDAMPPHDVPLPGQTGMDDRVVYVCCIATAGHRVRGVREPLAPSDG